jgi:hypothetical protein
MRATLINSLLLASVETDARYSHSDHLLGHAGDADALLLEISDHVAHVRREVVTATTVVEPNHEVVALRGHRRTGRPALRVGLVPNLVVAAARVVLGQ